jgi:hypothetical protein
MLLHKAECRQLILDPFKICDEENSLLLEKTLGINDLFSVPMTSLVLQGGKNRGMFQSWCIKYFVTHLFIYLLLI